MLTQPALRRTLLVTLLLGVAWSVVPASAVAAQPPWRAVETLREQLFDAQSELIISGPPAATAAVRRAQAVYRAALARRLRAAAPQADSELREALLAAARAAHRGDQVALAAARGSARAAVFQGSFRAALSATTRGEVAKARAWLLVREFRTATRFTRPGADATAGLDSAGLGLDQAGRRAAGGGQGPARRLPGPVA